MIELEPQIVALIRQHLMIVAISGTPYGGKSRLLTKFREDPENHGYILHQRITNRPRRNLPEEELEYVFLGKESFEKCKHLGELLVVERNFNYDYAIRLEDVRDAMGKGMASIVVTNVNDGFRKIREYYPDSVLIFVTPVELTEDFSFDGNKLKETLAKRVKRRKYPCVCSMQELYEFCACEIRALRDFDRLHIITNLDGMDNLESSYKLLKEIIHGDAPTSKAQ